MLRPAAMALALVAGLFDSASAATWDSNGAPRFQQTMAQRVTAQFWADQHRATAIAAERRFFGIPGDPTRAQLIDRYRAIGPVSDAVVVTTRTVTAPNVVKGLTRALPLIGTALVIKDLFDAVRCREAFGGGAACDMGIPPTNQVPWTCSGAGIGITGQGTSASSACGNLIARLNTTGQGEFRLGTPITRPFDGWNVERRYVGEPWLPFGAVGGSAGVPSLMCNAIRLPDGSMLTPPIDVDGRCASTIYEPASPDVLERQLGRLPAARVIPALEPLVNAGVPVPHAPPDFRVESPQQSSRDIEVRPDGSTTVRDTSYPWERVQDGYGWGRRIETREFPPGAVIPPINDPGLPPGTVQTPGTQQPLEVLTCGLPGRPPCKIDEEGTPAPVPPDFLNPVENPVTPLNAIIENPTVAPTGLTWSFQLPSACSVIALGDFSGLNMSFDLCRFQPMIHDLMTMVWLGFGILAAWGMVSRTLV